MNVGVSLIGSRRRAFEARNSYHKGPSEEQTKCVLRIIRSPVDRIEKLR